MSWPGSVTPFETVPPNKAVKYLGAYISLDLDWTEQVNKMQGHVMQTIAHITSGRLTTLQGVSIAKYVTGPKMDIGMRHADVPMTKLKDWDKWLSSAIAKRAGHTSAKLHASAVTTICALTPIEDQYLLTKLAHVLEGVTRKSQLKPYYEKTTLPLIEAISNTMSEFNGTLPTRGDLPTKASVQGAMPEVTEALLEAACKGLWVQFNDKCNILTGEEVEPDATGTDDFPELAFKGVSIPTRTTHKLWGSSFDKMGALAPLLSSGVAPPNLLALAQRTCLRTPGTYHHPDCQVRPNATLSSSTIGDIMKEERPMTRSKCKFCNRNWDPIDKEINSFVQVAVATDGSTYDGRDSGAAFVYVADHTPADELWQQGYGWLLNTENNYIAELSAIHRAMRSIPVNVDLTVHTDSQSSIDSILSALRCPEKTNYLRKGGRPYVMAICRAWDARKLAGATTTLKHVRAHTGGRSKAAVGNACADRLAKYFALSEKQEDIDDKKTALDLMEADFRFLLHTRSPIPGGPSDPKEALYENNPVHGDVRKVARETLRRLRKEEWADTSQRPARGRIVRDNPTEVSNVIRHAHSVANSSATLSLLLGGLNMVTEKDFSFGRADKACERCGTGASLTISHKCHSCPCNTHALNDRDEQLARLTGYADDIEMEGPSPTALSGQTEQRRRDVVKHLSHSTAATGIVVAGRTVTFPSSPTRPQAMKLDTFEQLHQYALLYNLTANRKAHENALDKDTLDQIVYTQSPKVSNHIMWLVDDIGRPRPRTQSPVLRQLCRWVLRTYSDLYLNPLTATAPWNDTWHSRHPDGWKVGGCDDATPLDFLLNRYTWVSMRGDSACQIEDLMTATQAARTSTRPCRVALLVQDSKLIQDMIKSVTPGVRKHTLATIGARTCPIFNFDDTDLPGSAETRPLHASQVTVLLVVVENVKAPGYDMCHVQAALEGEQGIEIHAPPHKYASYPPDMSTPPCPARKMRDRHHPLLRNSQTWCRAAHHYIPPPHACDAREPEPGRIQDRRSAGDRVNPILGLLGINPKGLGPDIASHSGITPTPPGDLKQISSLVLHTSVTMYRRSETYRRWRQKT
jgi:hypothetical protein